MDYVERHCRKIYGQIKLPRKHKKASKRATKSNSLMQLFIIACVSKFYRAMALNGNQVLRKLNQEKGSYIKHYLGNIRVLEYDGEEIGSMSYRVFQNLLTKGKIKQVSLSREFWSDGYYQMSVG